MSPTLCANATYHALVVGVIDGERGVVHQRSTDSTTWRDHAAVRIAWIDGRVASLRDYVRVDYRLDHAEVQPGQPRRSPT